MKEMKPLAHWFAHFKVLLVFAAHILTAIAVFCTVAVGAWALHVVRHWLADAGLDSYILTGMHFLEMLLFACDLLATGLWAIVSTKSAIVEILEK